MRRGVQFGPELTKEEIASGKTSKSRGLIFACYQTSITDGFAFMQEGKLYSNVVLDIPNGSPSSIAWANNPNFPPQTPEVPGSVSLFNVFPTSMDDDSSFSFRRLDPIIGQGVRQLTGTDPDDPTQLLANIPDFVIPRGGEYFFSPSVKALKETLATL